MQNAKGVKAKMIRKKSPISVYTKLSPNCTKPRTGKIKRLSPHGVGGNLSIEATLNLPRFITPDSKNGSSCGYAIGSDGRVGLGVEENNRSWCTSSRINDMEAITFEIANNGAAPDWRMSDLAINGWLDLAVEICKNYGFKKVNYVAKPSNIGVFPIDSNRSKNEAAVEAWIKTWAKDDEMIITLHNWYSAKACPGPYFMRQLPWLVREMNKRLQDANYKLEAFVGEGATPPDGLILTSQPTARPVLKKGNSGSSVIEAQKRLNVHGASPILKEDGSFGDLTDAAVRAFQKKCGLVVDGSIGPLTWVELDKVPSIGVGSTTVFKEYPIKLTSSNLNVRSGPGAPNYPIVKTLVNDKSAYTIVEESKGPGSNKGWGRLKSGIGWLSLDFVMKV